MKNPVLKESLVWAHVGDLHDRKPGDLWSFYQGLKLPPIPYTVTVRGYRCLFLDVVSICRLLKEHRVMLVDMGHTHYNELANDGDGGPWKPMQRAAQEGRFECACVAPADGSDADAIEAWPERHLLGTRLGPNRNGRQW